jgi:hypothetical protein
MVRVEVADQDRVKRRRIDAPGEPGKRAMAEVEQQARTP